TCPVGTERLFQYQARILWHPDPSQGPTAFDHDPRWECEVEGDAAPAVIEQATQVIAVGGVGDHVARVADDGVDGRSACVTVRECSGDGLLPPLVTFFVSATTDEKKIIHRGGGDKTPQPRKEQSRGQVPARAEDEQRLCLLVGGVVHEVFTPVHPANFCSTAPRTPGFDSKAQQRFEDTALGGVGSGLLDPIGGCRYGPSGRKEAFRPGTGGPAPGRSPPGRCRPR